MAHVVLFHSALGLRPAVHSFAQRLRENGHTVTTPDLFEGQVFDNLDDGVAARDAIGIDQLSKRAFASVADLPTDLVYAGFSMGAASAQALALHRPGALAAILMHGALPVQAFGASAWPTGLPAQIHATEDDPWVDNDVVKTLGAESSISVFRYPGANHLFADEASTEFVPASSAAMQEHVLALLRGLGS